jgi:glucose-1-phosphatase
MNHEPATIIFDLGGVLLNVDYHQTIEAFKKLGMKSFDNFFTQANQSKLFDGFDTGAISPVEFRNNIRNMSGLQLTDKQIDDAWNAMLLDMPPERIQLLNKVRQHYRTFLLSNTNAIHYPVYMQYMKDTYGVKSLEALFEKQYLSHEIHLRKPDKAVFDLIIQQQSLNPEQTLFIDDSRQHVEGARKASLKALWLNVQKNTVNSLFNEEGKLKGVVRKMTKA